PSPRSQGSIWSPRVHPSACTARDKFRPASRSTTPPGPGIGLPGPVRADLSLREDQTRGATGRRPHAAPAPPPDRVRPRHMRGATGLGLAPVEEPRAQLRLMKMFFVSVYMSIALMPSSRPMPDIL